MECRDELKFWFLGHVAHACGATLREVEEAAAELGIEAKMSLNGIAMINAIDAGLIERFLELKRKGVKAPKPAPAQPLPLVN